MNGAPNTKVVHYESPLNDSEQLKLKCVKDGDEGFTSFQSQKGFSNIKIRHRIFSAAFLAVFSVRV